MPQGIYKAVSAMITEQRQVDTIARNIANSETPGYRKSMINRSFADVYQEMASNGQSGRPSEPSSYHIFSSGMINETGNPYNVALSNTGTETPFFLVEHNGKEMLTRAGNFQTDNDGRLTTTDGWPVQGQGGDILIPPEAGSVDIDEGGRLYTMVSTDDGVQRNFIDQLRVVTVDDTSKLQAESGQFFSTTDDIRDTKQFNSKQGFIESSNVNPMLEIAEMVASQQRHDSAQRALSEQLKSEARYSDVLGGA